MSRFRRLFFLVLLVPVTCLSGCAGSVAEHVAAARVSAERQKPPTAPQLREFPHPLSYQPIQLAAHSEHAELIDVGFTRRYDVFCLLFPEQPTVSTVYRDCRILGTTDREGVKSSDFATFSKTARWAPSHLFGRMLVLETSDGRLAYIPPDSVRYIEEASASNQQFSAPPQAMPR
jgi:hypothetical protein